MSAVVMRESPASRVRTSWNILLLVVAIVAGSSGASMASEESILLRYSGRFELVDLEAGRRGAGRPSHTMQCFTDKRCTRVRLPLRFGGEEMGPPCPVGSLLAASFCGPARPYP